MSAKNYEYKRNKGVNFKVKMNHLTTKEKAYFEKFLPTNLKFTNHCKEQMKERKFNMTEKEMLTHVNMDALLEVQFYFDGTVRFLFRENVNSLFDVVFATNNHGIVFTTWLNNVNDNHKTLKDKHLYTSDMNKVKLYLK